jgi:hypothetical protein
MNLIWLAIILIIFLLLIGSYYYLTSREIFLKHKDFIEFWGIILSILLALLAVLQTQSSMESSTNDFNNIVNRMDNIITKAEESSESLQNVDSSLSKLPQQMDDFSKSIKSFDAVINSQRDQLNTTLNGLNISILTFKSSLDSMIERFNRRPQHNIDMVVWENDTSRIIKTIVITNLGKLKSEVYTLRLQIPKECVQKFEMYEGFLDSEIDGINYYQVNFNGQNSIIADKTKPRNLKCQIYLDKSRFDMAVIAYYDAAFGNDGSSAQIFRFRENVLRPILLNSPN